MSNAGVRSRQFDDLIFDIGAHKGEDSDFYLKLGYRVVGVEANPQLVAQLRERFREQIESGQYVLIDKAVGENDEPISFYINDMNSFWGTADRGWAKRNEVMGAPSRTVEIESVRFASIVERYGCPYYLKIDIEGYDMACVRALALLPYWPRFLSVESSKVRWADLIDEFDMLESLGYTRFRIVDQLRHEPGQFATVTGEQISYRFEEGASGPFGEHLAGEWLTRKQAVRKYRRIFLLYKLLGDTTVVRRIAARIPFLRRLPDIIPWYDTHAKLG